MQKPYAITEISDKKSIELVDNLFTILFRGVQSREIKTLEYTDASTPTVGSIGEKELTIVKNTVGVYLYTKVGGVLKFVAFT